MTNPLSLYVHIPWCVQKCPYCEFNSHTLKQTIPEQEYVAHLLADLDADLHFVQGRVLQSIFIGGGTPSLFSSEAIAKLLTGIQARIAFTDDIEVTLEANPGTIEAGRFAGFMQAGVNRISIGVQSFAQPQLEALGRIHDAQQAHAAIVQAKALPLRSFNVDLMHGLPDQDLAHGLADLRTAIAHQPPHLSWYQLTIEANTQFASRPPILPEDDVLWDIQEQGHALLTAAGYEQYEISAYAKPEQRCRHNMNYWAFGDYLGIGCGAHGKITTQEGIIRTEKIKHPRGYMDLQRPYLFRQTTVDERDIPFEYFMNRLRLLTPFMLDDYAQATGMSLTQDTLDILHRGAERGWFTQTGSDWQLTMQGQRYLNTLLTDFMVD